MLTPYWTERLGRDHFTAYQASRRGGRLTCRLEGDRVILGASCVTVMEGVARCRACAQLATFGCEYGPSYWLSPKRTPDR